MFRGFQNFVSELEASARPPPSQASTSQAGGNTAGQTQATPTTDAPIRRGSPGPQSPSSPAGGQGNSNAQLAENALSGLRKSFRSGAQSVRGSIDGYRQSSGDWTRFSQAANSSSSRPSSPAQSLSSPVKRPTPLAAAASVQEPQANLPTVPSEPEPQPEPAPWPPEPPVLTEDQIEESNALQKRAAEVELPPDPPEAPPKPEPPALSPEYHAVLAQHSPFKQALPSPEELYSWLASQAEQLSKLNTLQAQSSTHQSRIQELRDTHRLEVQSLNSELANMQAQSSRQAADLTAAERAIKEEEEKRTKSVNLLKAIRQKLTKAEQAKDEAEQAKQQAKNEAIAARSQSEAVVNKLRSGFEREIVSLKGLHEKESAGKKSQAELELLTLKSTHKQEMASKEKRVAELEARVSELSGEKDTFFDQGQRMEADLESARNWATNLEGQLNEKDVQLQEAVHQVEALQQELARSAASMPTDSVSSSIGSQHDQQRQQQQQQEALDALEQSYKSRISTLESKIKSLETSRTRAEADMSATMESRLHEVERMRLDMRTSQSALEEAKRTVSDWKDKASAAEGRLGDAQEKAQGLEKLLADSRLDSSRFEERIGAVREELADSARRTSELESRLEESHAKESQLRSTNKTLREELRKIQSGLLTSEKARNPGVGYFANLGKERGDVSQAGTPNTSSPDLSSATSPPLSASSGLPASTTKPADSLNSSSADNVSLNEVPNGKNKEAEAINFEYIRNVVLQFLEHKEMRPHLVGVLGVILHFTPQELRRVSARASS